MQTKLTLRLESELIQIAKKKAKEQGKSLSQIVADYFKLLAQNQNNQPNNKQTLSPITSSLVGIIDSNKTDIDDYKKHLEDKYL